MAEGYGAQRWRQRHANPRQALERAQVTVQKTDPRPIQIDPAICPNCRECASRIKNVPMHMTILGCFTLRPDAFSIKKPWIRVARYRECPYNTLIPVPVISSCISIGLYNAKDGNAISWIVLRLGDKYLIMGIFYIKKGGYPTNDGGVFA
jgi:hypothetical protein